MTTWTDPTKPVDARVDALLADLTLEEKVGQLGSIWPMTPPPEGTVAGQPRPRDVAPGMAAMFGGSSGGSPDEMWQRLTAHGLGQLTRMHGRYPQTVAQGVEGLRHWQRRVIGNSPHGIPAMNHEESLTGFCAHGATVYPASIAWGATFDPALVEEMARAIGADMKAVGVDQALSPLLDVVRDYRWGRVEETCGEDPYLVGTLGTAYVRGLQAEGVLATLKHYAGYSASKAGRNLAPSEMGTRVFTDMILTPFEMAVREGGAESVMNSYSEIDGVPAGASHWLLTEVLREEWGFEGTVVSDYFALIFLWVNHRIAADRHHAGRLALAAGLDVELPFTACFAELADAVAGGTLDEGVLDTAVRRVLRHKVMLGLLDPDFDVDVLGDVERDLDSAHNRAIARRMAEESIVLLANDAAALPLAAGATVALVGPTADNPMCFMGCYAYPNHVMQGYEGADDPFGLPIRSLKEVLAESFDIRHAAGVPVREVDTSGIADAVAAAADADVIVAALGDLAGLFGEGTSGEGCDVETLALPGAQGELLEALLATGKPVVLLLVTGRPYALGAYADRCAAIVQAFFPGVEAAEAITGVLTGRVNPSGKLPVQIPRGVGGQPGTYLGSKHAIEKSSSSLDPTPLFGFGHGCSYTTFALSDLGVSAEEMPTDGEVEVAVTVTNTGDRAGAKVVQLYLDDPVAQVVRPLRQLIGYAKVPLEAGEAKRVTFAVHADRFCFTGLAGARIVEPGEVIFRVGTASTDLPLEVSVQVTGAERVVEAPRLTTPVTVKAV